MRILMCSKLTKNLAAVTLFLLSIHAFGGDELEPQVLALLDAEQRLISRALDTSRIYSPTENAQESQYTPESRNTFRVATYWVPNASVNYFFADAVSPRIRALMVMTRNGEEFVRLAIHPESTSYFQYFLDSSRAEKAPDLIATATSSSRTLLVWEEHKAEAPFFAKLSLNASIAGVVRTIPMSEMARSIGHSNVLQWEKAQGHLPAGFDFFPETFSMIPKGMDRGAMIIREIPDGLLRESERVVPLFSLYAEPAEPKRSFLGRLFGSSKSEPPLLVQMIHRTNDNPYDFIESRILRPFLSQYFEMASKLSITMEPHAQNALARLDKDGLVNGRFVHRDFGGFAIDQEWRRSHGLDHAKLPFVRSIERDYHQKDDKSFAKALPQAITFFFNAGFVFNLDKAVGKWIHQGLVKGPEQSEGFLENRVFEILREIAIEHGVDQRSVPSSEDLKDPYTLFELLNQARKKTPALRPASACGGLFHWF